MPAPNPVYLDHNASTPPLDEVVEAMLPWLRSGHANPHSEHLQGRRAAAAVEEAKYQIGALIGADGADVVLTSGATEANNLALRGYLRHERNVGALVHTMVDHRCVMETAAALRRDGCEVRSVPVDGRGQVNPNALRAAVDATRAERVLVSVIHANNEIGNVTPLAPVAAALRGTRAVLHTDAAQSAGRLRINVETDGVDSLTMSSHKLGGPMGIGALYLAPELREEVSPLMHGGGQQDGLRPGTIPVFLAVGFGVACRAAAQRQEENAIRRERMAQTFLDALRVRGVPFDVLGDPLCRLPGLRSVRFSGVDARDLLDRFGARVSASTGSACSAGDIKPSHVLRAIGLSEHEANEVVRFGFDVSTTMDHAVDAAAAVSEAWLAATTSQEERNREVEPARRLDL